MLKKIAILLIAFQFTACTELQNIAGDVLTGSGELTSLEIGNGLKEALNIGISNGADKLSLKDGYLKSIYKIVLPEEVQKVTQRLSGVPGFNQAEAKMLELLNRAAEDAASEAKPIFVSAIKEMTFQDATAILMGNNDAATQYLHQKTYSNLQSAFQPKIKNSLSKVKATEYWTKAANTYNKIPLVQKVNPNIDDYVTTKALVGLFGMVTKEELKIRNNVSARTSDLLKKVFAKQDNR